MTNPLATEINNYARRHVEDLSDDDARTLIHAQFIIIATEDTIRSRNERLMVRAAAAQDVRDAEEDTL